MQQFNLIIILNETKDKVLMVKRSKKPYLGLYNFPGGKIEPNESFLESAYRELFEETGITKFDTTLKPFIDFTWYPVHMEMKVYIGGLIKKVKLVEEINELYWISLTENFFDMDTFAGEGNIGHMIEIYKQFPEIINTIQ